MQLEYGMKLVGGKYVPDGVKIQRLFNAFMQDDIEIGIGDKLHLNEPQKLSWSMHEGSYDYKCYQSQITSKFTFTPQYQIELKALEKKQQELNELFCGMLYVLLEVNEHVLTNKKIMGGLLVFMLLEFGFMLALGVDPLMALECIAICIANLSLFVVMLDALVAVGILGVSAIKQTGIAIEKAGCNSRQDQFNAKLSFFKKHEHFLTGGGAHENARRAAVLFMPTKGGVVGQFSEERVHERGLIAANSGEAIQKRIEAARANVSGHKKGAIMVTVEHTVTTEERQGTYATLSC